MRPCVVFVGRCKVGDLYHVTEEMDVFPLRVQNDV